MTDTVFTSRGARRYHADRRCWAMHAGRDLNEWDPQWVPGCRALVKYAVEEVTPERAVAEGRTPCRVCKPRAADPLLVEDFGHRPVMSFIDGRSLGRVCARCEIVTPPTMWDIEGERYEVRGFVTVRWPCTSALVLGLVDRRLLCGHCGDLITGQWVSGIPEPGQPDTLPRYHLDRKRCREQAQPLYLNQAGGAA